MQNKSDITAMLRGLVVVAGLIWPGALLAEGPAPDRQAQLAALAEAHGFAVAGLERLGGEPATPVSGDLRRQLEALLASHNFILLHDPAGRIIEVRIANRKGAAPKPPSRHAVGTTRQGPHHLVEAELTGPRARRRTASLIVDTGATTIVLPASMIEALGFRPGELRDGWSETANGRMAIKLGTLGSVRIGGVVARDVAVAFLADRRRTGPMLLGMSFLGRFRVTIDEANDQMILMAE